MRILIAPDAFKGSLSSTRAAEVIAGGIRDAIPDAEIDMMPLADGGEGTLDVLSPYVSHEYYFITNEKYAIYNDEQGEGVALIESARCLGLTLPEMHVREVWQRGSGALGECIRQGLDAGIRRFVIGLGGSATNDAGLGMLALLGLHAMNANGGEVSPDLQGLLSVNSLDTSDLDARLAHCDLTVLCDVDALLSGPAGATFTFGPQKGLYDDDLESVDQAVKRFADLAVAAFGRSSGEVPGDGAAGGLGFALRMIGGELLSGADYVIGKAGLAGRLHGVDWVVTGEGRSDAQTLTGKLPSKVAKLARASGVRVALISGDVDEKPKLASAFDAVIPARPRNMSVETAMDQAASLLRRAACLWAETT